ncbi:hypothetical protein EOPP23_03060 [Endozoicomonas sp. OPT23]|uniref:hypothetical protein n=1 Tax=Endozoicomonas sp. OPT23 TaxID=2072845 RepID=UPI00129B2E1C|nr:hypothetical protein [Endozoicomonas sp. OPT23]MRI31977.1 hypothetical protein [Endozoicomonas sp. OPT23]
MNTVKDIEIYAKNMPLADIEKWLSSHFNQWEVLNSGKVVHDFLLYKGDARIPLMIVENAVGKAWTSIWFKSGQTPWESDTACGKDLNKFANCRVRANAAPWADGEDMDEWWQITEQGEESTLSWPNAL